MSNNLLLESGGAILMEAGGFLLRELGAVTNLASISDATTAGYTLTESTRGIPLSPTKVEYIAILSKTLTPDIGPQFVFSAKGSSLASAAGARANVLTALNEKRKHRYAASPGAPDGAEAVMTMHGDLLQVDLT